MLVGCTAEVPGIEGREGKEEMGSGSGSGSGEQTTMTLSKYFDEIAQIHCEQAFSCRTSYPTDRGAFEDT